jgi:flagellar biosynthesis/type III secretory pathway protein FliH
MTFEQWWEKTGFQAGDYKGLAEKAWNHGYDEGREEGYENGVDCGYSIGYDDCQYNRDPIDPLE